jgi:hypothetical protein
MGNTPSLIRGGTSDDVVNDFTTDENIVSIIDNIASHFILSQNMIDMLRFSDKEYQDNMILLTSYILKKRLSNIDISLLRQRVNEDMNSVEDILAENNDIENDNINEELDQNGEHKNMYVVNAKNLHKIASLSDKEKQEAILLISKFYIKIMTIFSAVVSVIDPEYIYTSSNGIETSFFLKDFNDLKAFEPNNGNFRVHKFYNPKSLVQRRLHILQQKYITEINNDTNDNKDGFVVLNLGDELCASQSNDDTVSTIRNDMIIGLKELEALYYDEFDMEQKKWSKRSKSMEKKFEKDLDAYYHIVHGTSEKRPSTIVSFTQVQGVSFHKLKGCTTGQFKRDLRVSRSDKGFIEYKKHIETIRQVSNVETQKLVWILKQLFVIVHENDDTNITINPKMTMDRVIELQEQTKDCIINIHFKCEQHFMMSLLAYEDMVVRHMGIANSNTNNMNITENPQNINVVPTTHIATQNNTTESNYNMNENNEGDIDLNNSNVNMNDKIGNNNNNSNSNAMNNIENSQSSILPTTSTEVSTSLEPLTNTFVSQNNKVQQSITQPEPMTTNYQETTVQPQSQSQSQPSPQGIMSSSRTQQNPTFGSTPNPYYTQPVYIPEATPVSPTVTPMVQNSIIPSQPNPTMTISPTPPLTQQMSQSVPMTTPPFKGPSLLQSHGEVAPISPVITNSPSTNQPVPVLSTSNTDQVHVVAQTEPTMRGNSNSVLTNTYEPVENISNNSTSNTENETKSAENSESNKNTETQPGFFSSIAKTIFGSETDNKNQDTVKNTEVSPQENDTSNVSQSNGSVNGTPSITPQNNEAGIDTTNMKTYVIGDNSQDQSVNTTFSKIPSPSISPKPTVSNNTNNTNNTKTSQIRNRSTNNNRNVSRSLPQIKLRSEFASNTSNTSINLSEVNSNENENKNLNLNQSQNPNQNGIVRNTNSFMVQSSTETNEKDVQKGGREKIKQDIRNLLS